MPTNRTLEEIENALVATLQPLVTAGDLKSAAALSVDTPELLQRGRVPFPSAWVRTASRRFVRGSGTATPVYDAELDLEVVLLCADRRSLKRRTRGDATHDGVLDLLETVHATLDANDLGFSAHPALTPLMPLDDALEHPEPGVAMAVIRLRTVTTYFTG